MESELSDPEGRLLLSLECYAVLSNPDYLARISSMMGDSPGDIKDRATVLRAVGCN